MNNREYQFFGSIINHVKIIDFIGRLCHLDDLQSLFPQYWQYYRKHIGNILINYMLIGVKEIYILYPLDTIPQELSYIILLHNGQIEYWSEILDEI